MKKIGIHGSYFGRNFGDTLILHIIRNWVKEYSPEVDINLPFVTSEEEAIEILNGENKIMGIKELDGLIFGPGGYFGELPGNYLRKLRWSIRNYKRHIIWNDELFKNKIPFIIIGVGVGPITFSFFKRKVVKLFDKARYVSVRDKYSKQYLVEWGIDPDKIHVAPDVALTLQQNGLSKKGKKPKVALHYLSNNLMDSGKINDFVQFIKKISGENEIYLLEDSEGQYSRGIGINLKNILSNNDMDLPIIEYKDPATLIRELDGIDKIITSKLHVGIVGYALGKKVLSIPNHTKTIRFYEQIKQEEYCIPLKDINTKMLYDKFKQLDNTVNSNNILFAEAIKNKELLFGFLDTI